MAILRLSLKWNDDTPICVFVTNPTERMMTPAIGIVEFIFSPRNLQWGRALNGRVRPPDRTRRFFNCAWNKPRLLSVRTNQGYFP